jgi:hypothetical protein
MAATSLTYHAKLGLLVGGDAENDREYPSDEDEGIVGSGLFRDENASAETRENGQAGDNGEDDGHHV